MNTISMSNSLDPDQAQHFVGPDLGPKLFAKVLFSADNKSSQRVKLHPFKDTTMVIPNDCFLLQQIII